MGGFQGLLALMLNMTPLILWAESVAGTRCPDIEPVLYADISTSSPSPHKVGTVAKFTCDVGYKGVGKSSITCLKNGKWSAPSPYCTSHTCQRNLLKVAKGRKCRKRCTTDAQCKGTFKRCKCDDWCGKSCFNPNADCPKLKPPKNGYLIENGISYGHTVTYGCNEGYTISGPSTRRCRSDRKWSGYPPLCTSFSTCGMSGDSKDTPFGGKVLRGQDAKPGAWPWQVLLISNLGYSVDQIYNPNAGFGGGSIIDNGWILSAAHVFEDFRRAFKTNNWRDTFLIVVGMTAYPRRGHEIPDHVQIYEPQVVYKHESFDEDNFDYDVALIRLGKRLKRDENNARKLIADDVSYDGKLQFTRYIRPVCLPCMKGGLLHPVNILKNFHEQNCNPKQARRNLDKIAPAGSSAMVTGFGVTSYSSDTEEYRVPSILQEGQLSMVDSLKCAEHVKYMQSQRPQVRFSNRMFCASGANKSAKVDACQGDSGGPVVVKTTPDKRSKFWMQIGITSWGWGCGGSYPGYYTSVPSIMSWVWTTLKDAKIDPRNISSPWDDLPELQNITDNLPQVESSKTVPTISINSTGKTEVYFVINLSQSVKLYALHNAIDFATGLVRRLSLNDTRNSVTYGIVVFATKARVELNNLELPKKTPEQVIKILNNIVRNRNKIQKLIYYGADVGVALKLLNDRMIALSFNAFTQTLIKRHIFVFNGQLHISGGKPSQARRYIEAAYASNPPKFYSVSSYPHTDKNLKILPLTTVNYVFIDDFYKLHSYIDQITDVREDFSACGQAGDIGSVRKMVSLGRVLGGSSAAERAWPWQALITYTSNSVLEAFHNIVGGGSLINDKWVLTAAHLFDEFTGTYAWEQGYYVALGIIKRPRRAATLDGSVKIFIPERIIRHKQYMRYNGSYHYGSYQNDIALIKLGEEFQVTLDGLRLEPHDTQRGKVEFTPYIRPICLPCSATSCVSKILRKQDSKGTVLLNGAEDAKQKCEIEANFLSGKNKNGKTAAVVTGFGHNATLSNADDPIQPTYTLQQGILNIEERSKCKAAADIITRQIGNPRVTHIFTEEMLCAVGSSKRGGKLIDACKGDSGGPLSREVRDETTKESCFVQLGIVSWGYGCGQKFMGVQYPGFYTNVVTLMPWINETIAANNN